MTGIVAVSLTTPAMLIGAIVGAIAGVIGGRWALDALRAGQARSGGGGEGGEDDGR